MIIIFYKALTDLYGILLGITIDGRVGADESVVFQDWLRKYQHCKEDELFGPVFSEIYAVSRTGKINKEGLNRLMYLSKSLANNSSYQNNTWSWQVLFGVIKGIIADGSVTVSEVNGLIDWLNNEGQTIENKTKAAIMERLNAVIVDDMIDHLEEEKLMCLFKFLLNPVATNALTKDDVYRSSFFLSGQFNNGDKDIIAKKIKRAGGFVDTSFSKRIDYVVVGDTNPSIHAFGSYGTDVKRAIGMFLTGEPIHIISAKSVLDL